MGRFIYDGSVKLDIEDRTLAHLQMVMMTKLRRGEPFAFTWREDSSLGDGRTSVWIHPASSLVFRFAGSRRPALNPEWVDVLAMTANGTTGLRILPEPDPTARTAA